VEKYLPVHILEGELIVGGQFNTALSRSHTKAEAKRAKKLNDAWWKRAKRTNELGLGNSGVTPGHIIPNYVKVLKKGFKGLVADYKAEISGTKDTEKIDYLEAMIIAAEVPRILSLRYAEAAEKEAAGTKDKKRKDELFEVARIARKVPWEPAGSFHEALQSFWMTHMLVMTDESYPGPGLSPGRIDQYLYPFYKKDIDAKKITRDQAKELLDCLWIKHNYVYDFQGRIGENQGISAGFGQLITLGGSTRRGRRRQRPDLADAGHHRGDEHARAQTQHPHTRQDPDKLLRRIAELVIETQGSPFLINFDENSMRALKWQGLPEDKLWDYARWDASKTRCRATTAPAPWT